MIASRLYKRIDEKSALEASLLQDAFHADTPVQFFEEPGTITNIYSWEGRDVLYARGKPVLYNEKVFLRLDIQFLSNKSRDNLKVMLEGFPKLEDNARNNQFAGILFESNVPVLKAFCKKYLGFEDLFDNWLIKHFECGIINEDN